MSTLVRTLAVQIKAAKLPEPEFEFRFAVPRRWRFDLCWQDKMLACEVDGGTWNRGRHTRGAGYESDCQKLAEAVLRGWRVIRVTRGMIERGDALQLLERALAQYPPERRFA